MRKALPALLLVAAFSTSGCAAFKSRNTAPDEFAVARNAPLIIPPDYTLAPPIAGTATTPGEVQQQAIDALFGGPAPRSSAETSMLDEAGGDQVQIGIRSTAADPETRVVDKGETTVQILQAPPANTEIASAQAGQ